MDDGVVKAAPPTALLLGVLEAAGLVAVLALEPPAPVPATAPAVEFSAERAMAHVHALAREPRPVGSAAHARARDHILAELSALGLEPSVQEGTIGAVALENVLARISGSGIAGAVLLCAHYDSVPAGPGAGDDAAGVATLLETARALRAGPRLRNDVILLFTDGEETNLKGARLFVTEHPWIEEVRLVLNFEARGNAGPSILFETSPENGPLIREVAAAAPHPVANSFSRAVYRLLPNDTDYTVFRQKGIPGLNFAFIDGIRAYHTMLDTPETLSAASLQHHGSYALSLAARLGSLDAQLPLRGPDAVYFNVFGSLFARYYSMSPAPGGIAACIFATLLAAALRRRRVTLVGLWQGLLLQVVVWIEAVGWLTLVAWTSQKLLVWAGAFDGKAPWSGVWAHGLFSLGVFNAALWIAARTRRQRSEAVNAMEAFVGAIAVVLGLLLASQRWLEGATFLFLWPCLAGLAGLAYCVFADARRLERGWFKVAIALVALPGVLLYVPAMYLVFLAMARSVWLGVLASAVFAMPLVGMVLPILPAIPSSSRDAR